MFSAQTSKSKKKERNYICELKSLSTETFLELQTSNTEIKVMAEANVNVADEFEIGEEDIAVFLLNQVFDEGVLEEEE